MKPTPGKLGNSAATDMGDDKPHINGTEPVENGVSTNGTTDVEMKDDSSEPPSKPKQGKDKDGDEEMTVVVPPSKGPKLSGEAAKDREGDVAMEGTDEAANDTAAEVKEDPVAKAVSGKFTQRLVPISRVAYLISAQEFSSGYVPLTFPCLQISRATLCSWSGPLPNLTHGLLFGCFDPSRQSGSALRL
jgi:hypothetical protein